LAANTGEGAKIINAMLHAKTSVQKMRKGRMTSTGYNFVAGK
jgi:hypothetical protein